MCYLVDLVVWSAKLVFWNEARITVDLLGPWSCPMITLFWAGRKQ